MLPWDASNPKPRPLLVFLQATRLIRHLSDPSHPPLTSFDARMDTPDPSITFDVALKDLISAVRPHVQNVAYKRTILLPQTVLVIQRLLKKHAPQDTHALTMGCNKNWLLIENDEIRIACYKHIDAIRDKLPWAESGMAPSYLLVIQQIGRLIDHFRNHSGQMQDFVPSIDQRIERTPEQSAHAATYAYLRQVTYPKYQPPINHLQTIIDALVLVDGILATHSFEFTVADYMAKHDAGFKQKRKDQRRKDKLKKMTECGNAHKWKVPRQS
ncbi:hypothetical protein IWW56_001745 [Coemansia sp. RSA 2131]|nr:hypothetical protein IWW56_001745 [Coemansia sp. RSA 2131]